MTSDGELRLYAIGIDEVRDLFGADEARREELRASAIDALGIVPEPRRTRLWAALFRTDPQPPPADPDQPTLADVDTMLTGRHVTPDRTVAAWRLAETMISALSWDRLRQQATFELIDATDFALACAGMPAALGIRMLIETSPMLPLPPLAGVRLGYLRGHVARTMGEELAAHAEGVSAPEQRALAHGLAEWLLRYPVWAQQARGAGRPAPDLLTFCFH